MSFGVEREDPAKDMENFIEMGYDFVLDADVSSGETSSGNYKVFVELERSRHVPDQILILLDGIERLTGMPDMRFRYFKSFKSHDVTIENLKKIIPTTVADYRLATQRLQEDNFQQFFKNSIVDDISINNNNNISFHKQWSEPLEFKIINSGPISDIYSKTSGHIMLESTDVSEILFLTKFIGNFNITKIGKTFIFENNGWGLSLERQNVI